MSNWYDDVTADEVIAAIDADDGSTDSWGYACDWLCGRCGVDCDGSYTISSIRAAVLAEDTDLLESC